MEEMLEVMKKQLKMQKLISGLLAVMLVDRKSTRLNSSHNNQSRMPSSA